MKLNDRTVHILLYLLLLWTCILSENWLCCNVTWRRECWFVTGWIQVFESLKIKQKTSQTILNSVLDSPKGKPKSDIIKQNSTCIVLYVFIVSSSELSKQIATFTSFRNTLMETPYQSRFNISLFICRL